MSERGTDDEHNDPARASYEAELKARLARLGNKIDAQRRVESHPPSELDGDLGATTGFAQGFRLSTEFVAAIIAGAGLGWGIDRAFGLSPLGLIVFLMLGFVAGVLNVIRATGSMKRDGSHGNDV